MEALQHYGLLAGFGLIKVLVAITLILTITPVLTWMERRQSAMMQDRVGPNRANIPLPLPGGGTFNLKAFGLLHAVADGIKMVFKEDFVPRKAERFFFHLAPFIAVSVTFMLFAVIPMSGPFFVYLGNQAYHLPITIVQMNVGLLFLFALAPITVYSVFFAGWSSNNRWSLMGAVRASSQMLSYDVALLASLLGLVVIYGSYDLDKIANLQMAYWSFGSVMIPKWGIFLQPVAAIVYFIAALAETERAPFDTPEAESELVAGYFIEYSGMKFASFMTAEFVKMILLGAIMTTLFFGGYTLPGAQILHEGGATFLQVPVFLWNLYIPELGPFGPENILAFLQLQKFVVITFLFCFFQLLIRWTLPRYRFDQVMVLGWKWLYPFALINTVVTAIVVTLLSK